MSSQPLPDRIRQLRTHKHLSQAQLAALIGVKKNPVSTWERGTRKPDVAALNKLSEVFGVSFEYIIGGDYLGASVDYIGSSEDVTLDSTQRTNPSEITTQNPR